METIRMTIQTMIRTRRRTKPASTTPPTPPRTPTTDTEGTKTASTTIPATTWTIRGTSLASPGSRLRAPSFQRVTVAYLVLRDPARCRVYDEHGYGALVKAEAYAEDDVFDADPWDVYDRFFAGEEEEDRQYLLLHGGGGGDDSDDDSDGASSDPDNGSGESDDDVDDAMVEEALVQARHERFDEGGGRSANIADAPPPRPPMSVLMAVGDKAAGARSSAGDDDALPGLEGGDIWAALAKKYEADPVGEKRKRDDEERNEGMQNRTRRVAFLIQSLLLIALLVARLSFLQQPLTAHRHRGRPQRRGDQDGEHPQREYDFRLFRLWTVFISTLVSDRRIQR